MFRLQASILAVGLLLAPALSHAQDTGAPPSILEALPQDTDGTLNIEVVLLLKDLHEIDAFYDDMRERFERFELGREYLSSENQKKLLGFDMYREIARLAALMAPSGAGASAALAVYSNKGQFGAQLIMRAEEGFLDRVKAELASENPPPWKMSVDGDTLNVPIMEGVNFVGQVDEAGWLRIAPDPSMLIGSQGGGSELYSAKLAPYVERSDLALLIRPGTATDMLGGLLNEPMMQGLATTIKGALIGIELQEKTSAFTLALESDALSQYGPMARRPELQNWFVPMLDSQATSVFSLSLPPPAMAIAAEIVREAPVQSLPGGAKLAELVGELDGRIGFIGFDTPGDWALAIRFNSPEAASSFAPALQKVIDGGLEAVGIESQDFAVLEEVAGAGQALHFKPDALLEGWRVTALGSNVVTVPRTARLARLAALNGGGEAKKGEKKKKDKPSALIQGPLTPLVERTLNTPAIALAYTLASGDGAIFDYMIVPSKAVSLGLEVASDMLQDSPPMGGIGDLSSLGLHRLPLSVAVGMVGWLTTYDFGAAIDVRDTVLVLELVSSQI